MESLTFSLQALLVRHESYVASAEAERSHLSASIADLESEKRELAARNTCLVDENRGLLDQLEGLNGALGQSEAGVESLTATLQSTQRELQRLTVLAGRTEDLERQMEWLEGEYESLKIGFDDKDEEERTAVQRWKNAEQVIAGLHDQVERIEREAREERERHEELVGRMERTRAVEKELDSAAGRLKGAAALKTTEGNGPSVVSHFVKDILQDNADLRLGIVELRDMLHGSNEEVERLREQVLFHQPVEVLEDDATTPNLHRELQKELSLEMPQTQPQSQPAAVHVHHHYHAPEASVKPKRPAERRVKRKRNAVAPGVFASSNSRTSSFSSAVAPPYASASTILSQTAVSIPQQPQPHRWSMQSNQSYFSGSSSPYPSSNRASSVFDRVFSDGGIESSRPTSPESSGPASPEMAPLSRRDLQKALGRNSSLPNNLPQADRRRDRGDMEISTYIAEEDIAEIDLAASQRTIIPEEPEDSPSPDTKPQLSHDHSTPHAPRTSIDDTSLTTTTISADIYRPSLLRSAASHESLLSISGMDIHTLKTRPSQVLVIGSSGSGSLSSRFTAPSSLAAASASATVSATTATAARPTAMLRRGDSKIVLASVAGGQRCSSDGCGVGQAAPLKKKGSEGVLGGWMGGWVRGKWGYAPVPSLSPSGSSAGLVSRPAPPPMLSRQSSSPSASQSSSSSTSSAQRARRPILV